MDRERAISIGKGALLAAGGAVLGYLADLAASGELGQASLVVGAACSVLLNVFRKAMQPDGPEAQADPNGQKDGEGRS